MAHPQPEQRGEWIEVKILGSGGFGQVVLWKHEVSLINKQILSKIEQHCFLILIKFAFIIKCHLNNFSE